MVKTTDDFDERFLNAHNCTSIIYVTKYEVISRREKHKTFTITTTVHIMVYLCRQTQLQTPKVQASKAAQAPTKNAEPTPKRRTIVQEMPQTRVHRYTHRIFHPHSLGHNIDIPARPAPPPPHRPSSTSRPPPSSRGRPTQEIIDIGYCTRSRAGRSAGRWCHGRCKCISTFHCHCRC